MYCLFKYESQPPILNNVDAITIVSYLNNCSDNDFFTLTYYDFYAIISRDFKKGILKVLK